MDMINNRSEIYGRLYPDLTNMEREIPQAYTIS
jgi:hypothetical protein